MLSNPHFVNRIVKDIPKCIRADYSPDIFEASMQYYSIYLLRNFDSDKIKSLKTDLLDVSILGDVVWFTPINNYDSSIDFFVAEIPISVLKQVKQRDKDIRESYASVKYFPIYDLPFNYVLIMSINRTGEKKPVILYGEDLDKIILEAEK